MGTRYSAHCMFTWHERGHTALLLSQVGAMWLTSGCVRGSMWLTARYLRGVLMWEHRRGVWRISSPGQICVNEHFNHLAGCQSLLVVIMSAFPGDKLGKV